MVVDVLLFVDVKVRVWVWVDVVGLLTFVTAETEGDGHHEGNTWAKKLEVLLLRALSALLRVLPLPWGLETDADSASSRI